MKKSLKIKNIYQSEGLLVILLLCTVLVIGFMAPDRFFTKGNFMSMTFQMPELGLLSLGMMAVVLTGGINLSIVATAALSSIFGAFILAGPLGTTHPWLAIVLALFVVLGSSLICGAINGFFVSYVGVTAMLVTLGTMTLFEGIGLNLTKGGAISGFPMEFIALGSKTILGIPLIMLIYALLAFISYLILERSSFGVKIHMLGSNPIATTFSGIDVAKETFKVYLYSAIMCGLAGFIMISRYNSAKTDYGSSYVMQAITVVVLGGTSINGGHGTVLGTVIAAAIIQVVSTGLNILGINRNIVDIVIGAILILVLALRTVSNQMSQKAMVNKRKKIEG